MNISTLRLWHYEASPHLNRSGLPGWLLSSCAAPPEATNTSGRGPPRNSGYVQPLASDCAAVQDPSPGAVQEEIRRCRTEERMLSRAYPDKNGRKFLRSTVKVSQSAGPGPRPNVVGNATTSLL